MRSFYFPPHTDMHYIRNNFPEYCTESGAIDASKFASGAHAAAWATQKIKERDENRQSRHNTNQQQGT